MYWLLDDEEKKKLRDDITGLVEKLAAIEGNPHIDQLFPFVGRKDKRKAMEIISSLSADGDTVIDPFVGSGTFAYAAMTMDRRVLANEWEPYTHRMMSAPWRVPIEEDINPVIEKYLEQIKEYMDKLYRTVCECGSDHVLDSLFFDRDPLNYDKPTTHERLGSNGESVTYRGKYACPNCGRKEKHFSKTDKSHMEWIDAQPIQKKYRDIIEHTFIINSRINITSSFSEYSSLFPKRSLLALTYMWEEADTLDAPEEVELFIKDAILAIIPQAKYKDYRSKSQDLHIPKEKLREVNLYYRLMDTLGKRFNGLHTIRNSWHKNATTNHRLSSADFREFISSLEEDSVSLVLTDPPWTDGNPYFEKAQLYHPWLHYDLKQDSARLAKEFVVTDAPTRKIEHDEDRWWSDFSEFLGSSYAAAKNLSYLVLFFRPIPASNWLNNLNLLKFHARKQGFEPLITIDVAESDPSMRIQQSAAYLFSQDIAFLMVKLPEEKRRVFIGETDLDHLVFKTAEILQDKNAGPFTRAQFKAELNLQAQASSSLAILTPSNEEKISNSFSRYLEEVSPGFFLPKPGTPFSGQLFDTPAVERLIAFVPEVINELVSERKTFTYDIFLLKLAEFVENGTRSLISQVQEIDLKKMVGLYADIVPDTNLFKRRELPDLPKSISRIQELDPYEFEDFTGVLFSKMGFTDIAIAGRSGDRGVDVIAKDPNGILTVIQCKRYLISNVGSEPVQRLHSFSITRNAKRRILVTSSGFTKDGLDEAKITQTELINGDDLADLVGKYLPDFIK